MPRVASKCRQLPQPMTAKNADPAHASLARHRPQGNLKMLRGIRRHSRASRAAFLGPAGATISFSSSVVGTGGMRQMAGRIGTDGLPSAPALQPWSSKTVIKIDARQRKPLCLFRDKPAQKAHPIRSLEDSFQRLSLCRVASHVAPTVATAPRLEMCVNTTLRLGRSFSSMTPSPHPVPVT